MQSNTQAVESNLDYKSVELRSLFELSQILNASLDVHRVLNNCLLTLMGRMLISRGMALIVDEAQSLDGIFTDIAADLQSTCRLRYCTPKIEGDHVLRITAAKGLYSGWIEISFNADELSAGECDPAM